MIFSNNSILYKDNSKIIFIKYSDNSKTIFINTPTPPPLVHCQALVTTRRGDSYSEK